MKKKSIIILVVIAIVVIIFAVLIKKNSNMKEYLLNETKNANIEEYIVSTKKDEKLQTIFYIKNKKAIQKILDENGNPIDGKNSLVEWEEEIGLNDIFLENMANKNEKARFLFKGIENIDGKDCYKVIVYKDNGKITFYIDKELHYTRRIEYSVKDENNVTQNNKIDYLIDVNLTKKDLFNK